jgi:DNA repair protein RecO (recombination protein O)
VKFLSRDLGWLTGVAKNAKKSRVRFGGHLEQFALVDLFLRPRRDEMVWIDDAQMVRGFLGIRSDIGKVGKVAYFLELGSLFVPEGQPDSDLFDFLLRFLESVESSEASPLRYLLDEILLLGILGFEPRFDLCPACGKPLRAGDDGVFSAHLGGACHRACVPPRDPANLTLSPDTLAVVRRGLEVARDASNRLRLSRKGVEELRSALSALVRHVRGEQINSLLFLETMGF